MGAGAPLSGAPAEPPEAERRRLHAEEIAALAGYRRAGAIRPPSGAVLVTAVR